jgi:lysyl-tRNA synthetase class 2
MSPSAHEPPTDTPPAGTGPDEPGLAAGGVDDGEGSLPELRALRREKVAKLRAQGVEPYPHAFAGVVAIEGVHAAHADLAAGQDTDQRYRVAGRLHARRGQGGMAFLDLDDRSGRIQLQARRDVLGEESMQRLLDLDLGDLIGVDGLAFSSRSGELSLRVEDWTLLAKSLRPPPDKFHGLQDVELRLRHRELDLMANPESREVFLARARVISSVRSYLDSEGFVEAETPVLQPLYGGALARPFITHHNALDRDLYLRIATELYLKRLLVGGLERVYELGKDFRNEGISFKHNPEFTMVEWYEAYADYLDEMERVETVVHRAALASGYSGPLDLTPPWPRVRLTDAIAAATGIDPLEHRTAPALAAAIEHSGLELETTGRSWAALVDDLLSKHVEPTITDPVFLCDYPLELSPFAKTHRSEPGLAERFEAFAGGMEIANAFTELNDPDEQRRRFEEHAQRLAAGEEELQPFDEGFLEALEHGMPPAGGVGLGIDRLVMLLTGRRSIREVVLFPALR